MDSVNNGAYRRSAMAACDLRCPHTMIAPTPSNTIPALNPRPGRLRYDKQMTLTWIRYFELDFWVGSPRREILAMRIRDGHGPRTGGDAADAVNRGDFDFNHIFRDEAHRNAGAWFR
jgi:hypothetical protein